ncbi:MAG: DUF2357 domain-containing protein [Verrucomicrobiales bacterium]
MACLIMTGEHNLLTLSLPGVAEFSIHGPPPDLSHGASPALALTNLTTVATGAASKLCVLSESIKGRSVRTIPFLFEQTVYQFHLALEGSGGLPTRMLLRGTDLLTGRCRIGSQEAYAIPVNFQSEIGYTDLEAWRGSVRLFALRLEVFPTKLDYRTDLFELRADLQMEVRSLIFELYGRTFQLLRRGARSRPQDIDWLTLLRGEFQRMVRALELIIRSPLERVAVSHELGRSTRASRRSTEIRQYLRSNGSKCVPAAKGHFSAKGYFWLSPQLPCVKKRLSTDTSENRYVAAAVSKMRSRLRRLLAQLAGVQRRERFASWTSFLEDADDRLRHFQTQTFLGELLGQHMYVSPTLALHLTPGYREFFSSFLALDSILEVGGGPLELPEKDLATLYELWCFVALAGILREELNLKVQPPSWLRVTQRRVALELVKGKHAVITMEKDGQECLKVIYSHQSRTPTGFCTPDNTLEIFKDAKARTFRYVFDAKYRLSADEQYKKDHGAPGPPVDAVYRMHAYRDQIVAEQSSILATHSAGATVWDLGFRQLVQQTVGAFVLYPYAGADADQNTFVEAIPKVGVGAVPFLPSRRGEVTKLLRQIIEMSADAVEDTAVELSTVEERQRIEWAHQYGLIGIVPSLAQLDYILQHRIYHTPYKSQRRWGLRLKADFILLLLSETNFPRAGGVAYQAEIRSVHFGDRHEIVPSPPASTRQEERYVWFVLSEVRAVKPVLRYKPPMPYFAFTTRLAFREAENVAELLLIREPERRFYRECRQAGLEVNVYDEARGQDQVFDIRQLRLLFVVSSNEHPPTTVRFHPETARFTSGSTTFTWSELMFRTDGCLAKLFPHDRTATVI